MARQSLADKAYQHIKEWIIEFRLKPGSLLSTGQLAEALGVSQTPVREALSRLEQEYLVTRTPMKGFTVRGLELKEVGDLFEVRAAIELLAVKQAALRMDVHSRKQLANSLQASWQWIKAGEISRLLKLEQNFHMKILEASANRALIEVGSGVLGRIWAIQTFNITTSEMLAEAHEEHCGIFRAMCSGNAKRSQALMRKHMKHTIKVLIARLKDRNDIIQNAIAFDPRAWRQFDPLESRPGKTKAETET